MKVVITIQVAAGSFHVLALSHGGSLYFWGNDGRRVSARVPEGVKITDVDDIAALRGYGLNVCKSRDGNVYFWGCRYGKHFSNPRETRFTTMDEVFASLDVPLLLKPLQFDCIGQDFSQRMELAFNDAVAS